MIIAHCQSCWQFFCLIYRKNRVGVDRMSQEELNDQLIANTLPSFNQLISDIKATPQKVLKRGKIKNLDEYYIIKEFLDNQTSDISDLDREQLDRILWTFESRSGKTKNAS